MYEQLRLDNVDLFNELPEEDKLKITKYLMEYVHGKGQRASTDYILRYWNSSKQQLYKNFGNQFIISKHIKYLASIESLMTKINDVKRNNGVFKINFLDYLHRCADNSVITYDDYFNCISLLDSEYLANNHFSGKSFNVTINGKKYSVQNGTKPMRILGKMAKDFGLEKEYEEFRIAVSMVTNQRLLEGELCLSIHPLDYMTMSENNENWSSCMNWEEPGCYCRGTVEMMNSGNVIVAYLASSKQSEIGPIEWNSKKWRTLFIVDPDLLVSVKSYPYYNESLIKETLKFIQEIMPDMYGPIQEMPYYTEFQYNNQTAKYYTDTNAMYNDFGHSTTHWGAFGKRLLGHGSIGISVNYSGVSECMYCGTGEGYFASEGSLMCEDCDNIVYCQHCEEAIDKDEAHELDGEYYCSWCYGHVVAYDDLTNEAHHEDNMRHLYITDDTRDMDEYYVKSLPCLYLYEDYVYDLDLIPEVSKYFNNTSTYSYNKDWHTAYYVNIDQLTPETISLMGYTEESLLEQIQTALKDK